MSDPEMKHNHGNKYKQMNIFCCNSDEQICVTLHKKIISNGMFVRVMNGHPTLIVNMGMEEWKEGLMYSALLCTKSLNDNSPKRRRPIAFADKGAIESSYNIQKLLEQIYDDIKSLKDNSSVLRIGNDCVILKCSVDKKYALD